MASRQRNANERWEAAVCWLHAEQIRDLFVYRASLTYPHAWRRFVELAAITGLHLWLITDQPVTWRGRRDLLNDWDAEFIDADEFLQLWDHARPSTPPTPSRGALHRPPTVERPIFIAARRRQLPTEEFQHLLNQYVIGAAAAHDAPLSPADGFAATEKWLRQLVLSCTSAHEVIARLRGVQQTFCLRGGAALLIQEERFYAHGTIAAPFDDPAANALRGFIATRFAALGAVRLLTKLPPTQTAALRLSDVATDGTKVTQDGEHWDPPPFAQGILRAHRLSRRAQGALDDDPIFVREDASGRIGPVTERAVRDELRKVAQLTGLPVAEHPHAKSKASMRSWLHNRGISVQPV